MTFQRVCFILLLFLTACREAPAVLPAASPTPFTGQPRRVIIDTDMAGDDWMAILYLLQRPDITVEAITVAGTGEAHCEPGVRHAAGLVALAGEPVIPIACGRETPWQGTHAFPDSWRENVDHLYGLTLPEGTNATPGQDAAGLLTATIQASPLRVTLITLGPLTNVAQALQGIPSLVENLEMVYIMGGAVDVPGNIAISGVGIDNGTAEWNLYADPGAAKIVFESGLPITLVPLDATNQVPITTAFYKLIKKGHATLEATFVYDLLTSRMDFIESGGYFFWDPLTAAILTDESLAQFETRRLTVVDQEGPESGRTRPDENGAQVRVAVSADAGRFEQAFLEALNAP